MLFFFFLSAQIIMSCIYGLHPKIIPALSIWLRGIRHYACKLARSLEKKAELWTIPHRQLSNSFTIINYLSLFLVTIFFQQHAWDGEASSSTWLCPFASPSFLLSFLFLFQCWIGREFFFPSFFFWKDLLIDDWYHKSILIHKLYILRKNLYLTI